MLGTRKLNCARSLKIHDVGDGPEPVPGASGTGSCVLGRSNVGKSSVINSLLGTKIAKTSSTPGRTRAINFFEVRWPGKPHPEVVFSDLPGYGYARVPRDITDQWSGFIDPYLKERRCLALSGPWWI